MNCSAAVRTPATKKDSSAITTEATMTSVEDRRDFQKAAVAFTP